VEEIPTLRTSFWVELGPSTSSMTRFIEFDDRFKGYAQCKTVLHRQSMEMHYFATSPLLGIVNIVV